MTDEEELENKMFHEFLYDVENILDEFLIAVLSFGAIVVTVWSLFFSSSSFDMIAFGKNIAPWIIMLSLMIIGRELWLLNRRLDEHLAAGE
ncbi:MAG: hypothetical protein ABEK01_03680 [Candidatus Nanohaloarchaea archaeon]